VLGALAAIFVWAWLIDPWLTARRLAREVRRFEDGLRGESIEALRDLVIASPYWDMVVATPLRDEPAVRDFFARFDAEQYGEILDELGDGIYLCGMFGAAERSIGWRGRPQILDYDGVFVPVLKELRRRVSGRSRGTRA
jgi:hypothetical protein